MKNWLEEINKIATDIPIHVMEDINQRVEDWLISGGDGSDPYIEQQWRYAKRFVCEKAIK